MRGYPRHKIVPFIRAQHTRLYARKDQGLIVPQIDAQSARQWARKWSDQIVSSMGAHLARLCTHSHPNSDIPCIGEHFARLLAHKAIVVAVPNMDQYLARLPTNSCFAMTVPPMYAQPCALIDAQVVWIFDFLRLSSASVNSNRSACARRRTNQKTRLERLNETSILIGSATSTPRRLTSVSR